MIVLFISKILCPQMCYLPHVWKKIVQYTEKI